MRWIYKLGVVVCLGLLACCGSSSSSEAPAVMPDVVGARLDVAKSDLAVAGVDEDNIEVVGGGMFGVVVESNWTVCEQSPSAGEPASDVRVVVDRECPGDDGEADTNSTPETTTTAAPSTSPPTTEPPQQEATASEAEVIETFRAYYDERAASGVLIAQAITDVSFSNRVLRVTFDPAAAGIDQATFDQINSFDNLADFAGAGILAFTDETGNRMRPAVDAVETVLVDGTPLGTRTTEEISAMNGIDQ